MNNVAGILVTIILGISLSSYAQEGSSLSQRIKASPYKELEVRTAPLAFYAKWVTLDVAFRMNKNFTLGPSAIVYAAGGPGSMFGPTYDGFALGGNANYYFNSVTENSFYLGSHIYYQNYIDYPHASTYEIEREGFNLNTVVGYYVKSDIMLLHMGIGGEAGAYFKDERKNTRDYSSRKPESRSGRVLPFIEFKVGVEI